MTVDTLPRKGLHHLRRILEDEHALSAEDLDLLLRAAALRAEAGTFHDAERIARRARSLHPALLGPRLFLARLLSDRRIDDARPILEAALGQAIVDGDADGEAAALYLLGRHLHASGAVPQARPLLERTVALRGLHGPTAHLHNAQVALATLEEDAGRPELAVGLLRQAMAEARGTDLAYAAREVLARVLFGTGEYAEALEVLAPVLDDMPTHYELEIAALLHHALGHWDTVVTLLGQAVRQAVSMGDHAAATNLLVLKARSRSDLGEQELAWENLVSARVRLGLDGEGEGLGDDSDRGHCAIQCAIVARRMGRDADATTYLHEAARHLDGLEPETHARVLEVLDEHQAGTWRP